MWPSARADEASSVLVKRELSTSRLKDSRRCLEGPASEPSVMPIRRRFPPPWAVEEQKACFVLPRANTLGHKLGRRGQGQLRLR
jgi:hypothetical protein